MQEKNLLSRYDYEKQYNVIYSLIKEKNVDGIIVGEYLKAFITFEEYKEFLQKRFANIPLVTLGCKIENIPTVHLDHEKGVIEAIDHLAIIHRVKNSLH